MSSRKNATKISIHCTWGKWNLVDKDHLQKRRNWTRYWQRIVGLTWWLNVWKRKNTNIIRWLSLSFFWPKMNVHYRFRFRPLMEFHFHRHFRLRPKMKYLFGRPLVYITKRSWYWFWSWDPKSWFWSWTLGLVLVLKLRSWSWSWKKVSITSLSTSTPVHVSRQLNPDQCRRLTSHNHVSSVRHTSAVKCLQSSSGLVSHDLTL